MEGRSQLYDDLLADAGLTAPDETERQYLWQIVDEGALGASKHVALSQELFRHILTAASQQDLAAPDAQADPPAVRRARLAGDAIARTRGGDAPVVANAIAWLMVGLDEQPADQRAAMLRERMTRWQTEAGQRSARLSAVARAVLADHPRLLLFDYSSTVAGVVRVLAEQESVARLVVPESRCIAGGWRYLEELGGLGLPVDYVVDAAIDYAVAHSDAVLFGVESLYCDGSFLNTVGSRPVAERALAAGRPVYACGDLFKLDRRSYLGTFKPPRMRAFDARLLPDGPPAGAEVSTHSPELERVPPDAFDGLITDQGFVTPQAVWSLGRELFGATPVD